MPLRSVRRFVFENLVLQDELPNVDANSPEAARKVEQLCVARIQAAIDLTAEQRISAAMKTEEGSSEQFVPPLEPLVRLRIDTSGGFDKFSAIRFGQKFVNSVANPKVSIFLLVYLLNLEVNNLL